MKDAAKSLPHNQTLLARLEPLREKLIDVSLRSRLLNYRDFGSQTLPLQPCDLDVLYQWLVINEKELEVKGIPELESKNDKIGLEKADNCYPPIRVTLSQTENISQTVYSSIDFNGEDSTNEIKNGILRSRDSMLKTENRMTTLFRKYRECLDAFGSNLCFLAFGFLEWTDPKRQSDEKLYAPLILVPVEILKVKIPITKKADLDDFQLEEESESYAKVSKTATISSRAPKMMAYRFTIKSDGEDLVDNIALRLKLESIPGGISLPTFDYEDEDASIEEYLLALEKAIKILPSEVNIGWKVIRGARLAFFSSAKEAMYRDLDPTKWPASNLVNKEWVIAALDGRDQDNTPAITDDEVTTALHIDPVPTVLETDGSQMKAILRVLRGQSLVIQGPPGTGKSQTITNLIAATLAKGKSVLFVAEKMAALSVVRQRLEESGLGRYCLELHSAKATPRQVIDQVKKRLLHRPSANGGQARRSADRLRLNQHRMALCHYGNSIHQKDNNLELSFFDAVWRRSQLLDDFEELLLNLNTSAYALPELTMSEDAGYAELDALINALKVASRCIDEGILLKSKPWNGSCPRELPDPQMEERVRHILANAKQAAKNWQEAESRIPLHDLWNSHTADQWLCLYQSFKLGPVPDLPSCIGSTYFFESPLRGVIATLLPQYKEYLSALVAWREPHPEAARALSENLSVDNQTIEQAKASAGQIKSALISRFPHETIEELSISCQNILWLRDTLKIRIETLESIIKLIHVPFSDDTFLGGDYLVAFAERLVQLPPSVWNCINSNLLHPSSLNHLERAHNEYRLLVEERDAICIELRLEDLPSTTEWVELERGLRLTAGSWLNWLPGTSGNRLRKQLSVLFLNRPVNEHAAIQLVDRAQKWRAAAATFSSLEDFKGLLGSAFTGMTTDWTSLGAAVSLVSDWVKIFGYVSARRFIEEHKDEVFSHSSVIASLVAECVTYSKDWMALASTLFQQDESTLRQLSSQTLIKEISQQAEIATNMVESIEKLMLPPSTRCVDVACLCTVALKLRAHADTVNKLTANKNFLGAWHQGLLATNQDKIANAISWLEQFNNLKLPYSIKVWVLKESSSERVEELSKCIQDIKNSIIDWQYAMTQLSEVFKIDSDNAQISSNNLRRSVTSILTCLDEALEAIPFLTSWYHLNESEREIERAGGKCFWEWCREHCLKGKAVTIAAQYAFYNQFIERLLMQYPELKTYHVQKLEEYRDGFRKLDKLVLNSFQKEVDESIYRRVENAPFGQNKGSPKNYTEMSLLRHEINKQKRHVPVRKLIRQSGAALQYLQPCWMMGPQAVAQFLEPEKVEFDLLIIDEASQIRPEDALGSLARAKQIVIVGDSKQMPPTDVFQALGVDNFDDDLEDEGGEMISYGSAALELSSILDAFEKQLPSETLLWHYRSQHHSLIAFSNESFYESGLIVPPSRWHSSDDLGIMRHFLENGRLQNRKNPAEAEKTIEIMREHVLREFPKHEDERETLGVVAMNASQQDLISDEWEKACKNDPELEQALLEFTSKTSLFIRNLENVQGDERDVIVISTTYGKNAAGEMYQRFGPVNKAGGWRRLNVLFTRARKRIHLVTSMMHSDVQQDLKQNESGRNYLRKYLKYAETGHLPDSGSLGYKGEPDSEFEISVARSLRDLGFEFHYQVGVQGFFIDIGVIHPDHPGQYLCGIECDGAAYHSHTIARDRDRIRQEILENRGWRIFRIWSTDWYRNRKLEIRRLREFLLLSSNFPNVL